MKKLRRQRKPIKERNKQTNELLKFELAKLTGNCIWKVTDRNRAGKPFDMAIPQTHQPGWPIKSVKLL